VVHLGPFLRLSDSIQLPLSLHNSILCLDCLQKCKPRFTECEPRLAACLLVGQWHLSHPLPLPVNMPLNPGCSTTHRIAYLQLAQTSFLLHNILPNGSCLMALPVLTNLSPIPIDIIICCHLCLANCILPSTLINYVAGLLQFTKFCDDYSIPESEHMPTWSPSYPIS